MTAPHFNLCEPSATAMQNKCKVMFIVLAFSLRVLENFDCLMAIDSSDFIQQLVRVKSEEKTKCFTGPSCGAAAAVRADPSGSWGTTNCPALHPQLPAAQHRLAHGPAGESSHADLSFPI